MKILALDQASQTSGYAIFNKGELLQSGAFTVSGSLEKRLVKIRQKVSDFIQENDITNIVIEDIQLERGRGNNVVTYKALAEVIGVITELAAELKIPCLIVPSSTWRSELRIKGSERSVYKRNAQLYVEKNYNITATEDEADAICIGAYYCQIKNLTSAF